MLKSLFVAVGLLFVFPAVSGPVIPVNMYINDRETGDAYEILTCELAFVSQDFRETECGPDDCMFTVNYWYGTISCRNDGSPFVLKVTEIEKIDRRGHDENGSPYTTFESTIFGAYRTVGSISIKNLRVTDLSHANRPGRVCTDRRNAGDAVIDWGDDKDFPQICIHRK